MQNSMSDRAGKAQTYIASSEPVKTCEAKVVAAVASSSIISYLALCAFLCTHVKSDVDLIPEYNKVPKVAYIIPATAFGTSLLLHLLTLGVERSSVKLQWAIMVCSVNFMAAFNDWLSYMGVTPVLRDPWGQGFQIGRLVMWMWTTPLMVYLLTLISDLTPWQAAKGIVADVCMLAVVIFGLVQSSKLIGVLSICVAMILYVYVMKAIWGMFKAPLHALQIQNHTAALSLKIIRIATMVTWSLFIIIFMCIKTGMIRDVVLEEWLWGVLDVMGKVIFNSTLFHSNMMSLEDHKAQAAAALEHSRRQLVIKELSSLVSQKEQFISGMSHELRTPLNGIIGLSEALLIGCCGPLEAAASKTVATIKNSGSRLLAMINDILDTASMKHGRLILRNQRVDLRSIVDGVLQLCETLVRKNVQLVNEVPLDCPAVQGDCNRLTQILNNLVGNACKFTHKGSIRVGAQAKNGVVDITVTDTGIGIPVDKFDSIFQPFEQVDMSTTRQYGGTGLGLALVKQLVEAHGSAITVDSKLGEGTCFRFTLKVWDVRPAHATADVSTTNSTTNNTPVSRRTGWLSDHPTYMSLSGTSDRQQPRSINGSRLPTSERVQRMLSLFDEHVVGSSADHGSVPSAANSRKAADRPRSVCGGMFRKDEDVSGDRRVSMSGRREFQSRMSAPQQPLLRSSTTVDKFSFGQLFSPAQMRRAGEPHADLDLLDHDRPSPDLTAFAISRTSTNAGITDRARSSSDRSGVARDDAMAHAVACWDDDHDDQPSQHSHTEDPLLSLGSLLHEEDIKTAATIFDRPHIGAATDAPGTTTDNNNHKASIISGKDRSQRTSTERPEHYHDSQPQCGHDQVSQALIVSGRGSDAIDRTALHSATSRGEIPVHEAAFKSQEPAHMPIHPGLDTDGDGQTRSGPGFRKEGVLSSGRGAPETDSIHLLSVDDDQVNQMVVQTLLSGEGFRVVSAMSGQEAVDLIDRADKLPDIILLDVSMPGMTGYEVCKHIRSRYPDSGVPIIMVSARNSEEEVVQGLAHGANDYILKPFGQRELVARCRAHLQAARRTLTGRAGDACPDDADAALIMTTSGDSWRELLCGGPGEVDSSRGEEQRYSLPGCVKTQIEQGTYMPGASSMQVFSGVTVVVAGISNLSDLQSSMHVAKLLGVLTSVHVLLETSIQHHAMYLVDCLENRLVAITGLGGESGPEQAAGALSLAQDLHRIAACTGAGLEMSVGIHTGPAAGFINGVRHPVLCISGALTDQASQLQELCPPGCIHVSSKVHDLLSTPAAFLPGVSLAGGSLQCDTFLHNSGPAAQMHGLLKRRLDTYMADHPFGPIHSQSPALKPVQQALLSLLQSDPAPLVEAVGKAYALRSSRHGRGRERGCSASSPTRRILVASSSEHAQGIAPGVVTSAGFNRGAQQASSPRLRLQSQSGLRLDAIDTATAAGNHSTLPVTKATAQQASNKASSVGQMMLGQPDGETSASDAQHDSERALLSGGGCSHQASARGAVGGAGARNMSTCEEGVVWTGSVIDSVSGGVEMIAKLQLEKESLQERLEGKAAELGARRAQIDSLHLELHAMSNIKDQLNTTKTQLNTTKTELVMTSRQLDWATQQLADRPVQPLCAEQRAHSIHQDTLRMLEKEHGSLFVLDSGTQQSAVARIARTESASIYGHEASEGVMEASAADTQNRTFADATSDTNMSGLQQAIRAMCLHDIANSNAPAKITLASAAAGAAAHKAVYSDLKDHLQIPVMQSVDDLLVMAGLSHLRHAFQVESITCIDMINHMTDEELDMLGVNGQQKKDILRALAATAQGASQ